MKNVVKDERPGFYIVQNELLDRFGGTIGPNGIAVYNALCRFASRDGTSFPSLHKIATLIGMSRPTVVKYLALLKEQNLISVETRTTDAGDPDSNLYTLKNPFVGVVNDVTYLVNDVDYGSKAGLPGVVNDVYSNNTYLNNTQLPTQPSGNGSGKVPAVKKLGDVHKCWQENMPGTLTPIIVGQIDELITEYGPDAMLRAIAVAVNANIRTMRYIKGVLQKDGKTPKATKGSVTVKRVEGEDW